MTASRAEQTCHQLRRGPNKVPPSPVAADSSSGPQHEPPSPGSLRKAETFHSPTSASTDRDPVLNFRSLPKRSPTCPQTLEAVAAGEQRMTDILSRLSLNSTDSPDSMNGFRVKDDLPVPTGILQAHIRRNTAIEAPNTSTESPAYHTSSSPLSREKAENAMLHASDSGLGTSIGSRHSVSSSCQTKVKAGQMSCAQETQSAITSSISAIGPRNPRKRQMGLAACKQIERLVLAPILREERLKPFHPLVHSVPQRIAGREIGCLRDLEKTLLWLTPDSVDRKSFVDFWEVTVRCLHTTAAHLNDRDLRLPSDRPYTNGYFLDLVDQLRQHAAMISTQADRQSDAKPDASKNEHLSLEGGLSKTGRPAEFVVRKGDEAISLRTGAPYQPDAAPTFKRSLSLNSADEGVERSMARRKKNAPPMDINKKCTYCTKRFKRPCDLTKHEKTHIRPAKCPEPSCKYSVIGWANEKERDRHVNDKHCKSPKMFKCDHPGCPYESKRESNCKQHMEKAHGYEYSRTKGNGKQIQKGSSVNATPQTASISTPASKMVELPTPSTGPSLSPSQPPSDYSPEPTLSFADPPAQTGSEDIFAGNGGYNNPSNSLHGFDSIAFDAFQTELEAADPNGLFSALDMHRQSLESSVPELVGATMGVDDLRVASTENTHLGVGFDWDNVNEPNRPSLNGPEEYRAINAQVVNQPRDSSTSSASPHSDHEVFGLSPGVPSNVMLYTPDEAVPDLYTHAFQDNSKGDFPLYEDTDQGVTLPSHLPGLNPMFPSIDATDDYLCMDQWWAGHPAMAENTAYPMDLDMEFTG